MYLVTYADDLDEYEVMCASIDSLFKLLIILQDSNKVRHYRVILSDATIVNDFYIEFGWGDSYFTKNKKQIQQTL